MPTACSWTRVNVVSDSTGRRCGTTSYCSPTLVIGYGNDLRGDDAAGIRAAALIASQSSPPHVIITQQLTPDLAADIARAGRVVFVDAYEAKEDGAKLRVEKVVPSKEAAASPPEWGHHSDPASLVDLAGRLFGAAPDAWIVGIPAFCFDAGDTLSAGTLNWIDEAVALIEESVILT